VTRRLAAAVAIAVALLGRAEIAEAACTEAGACATNEYCATNDGGVVVTDGGAGVCTPEPCVVSTDCSNGDLCDTSQQPFKCVECISTADCSGDLLCDVATHMCVAQLTGDGGNSVDASESEDGSLEDGGEEGDATLPISTKDASADASEAGTPVSLDAGPDTGSLSGGACDCTLATPRGSNVAALGSLFALGLIVFARRNARSKRKPRR